MAPPGNLAELLILGHSPDLLDQGILRRGSPHDTDARWRVRTTGLVTVHRKSFF